MQSIMKMRFAKCEWGQAAACHILQMEHLLCIIKCQHFAAWWFDVKGVSWPFSQDRVVCVSPKDLASRDWMFYVSLCYPHHFNSEKLVRDLQYV